MTPNSEETLANTITKRIDQWLEEHQDETFDLDLVCRHCEITSMDGRIKASKRLSRLVKEGRLEKNNKIYRYINNNIISETWWEADETYFKLTLPASHHQDDLSYFPFNDSVVIPPKSIVVIAGQTSAGKSTFIRNLLWDNMHSIHCRLMVSETSAASFRRYSKSMTWAEPMKDGKPVFDFISRTSNFQDIILPDSLNLIDWLDVASGEFYRIGQELLHIKEKLNNGIAVVAIQKDGNKEYGRGNTFSIELATMYLTIDYNRDKNMSWVTVKKAKEWNGNVDPNNKVYGFQITDYGSQFSNIREIKKCKHCGGYGKSRGSECLDCNGTGWVDGYRVTHKPVQMEIEPDEIPD